MIPAISMPFSFNRLGIVTHVNEVEKTAVIEMEDKSGFCLFRYEYADDVNIGDILNVGEYTPDLKPDIFNQTQEKNISINLLRTNLALYQLKRFL